VGHPIPVKSEKPVDFSSIGGVCILPPNKHPMFAAKPEDSVEKEDESSEHRDGQKFTFGRSLKELARLCDERNFHVRQNDRTEYHEGI
jgi:hypothetical protein